MTTRSLSRNANWRGGKTFHPLYWTYMDMIYRCYRPTHKRYADYGGRGITVCDRWRDDFWNYVADVGERPSGLTLDRRDNDGPYNPQNCRWATVSEQNRNRRASAYSGLYNRPKQTRCRADKHDLTPENTRASRGCRECWNDRRRQRRAEGRNA